jgi:hypothetical protein
MRTIAASQYIFLTVRKGLLFRQIELSSPKGNHTIVYNGRGAGYESVIIDGVALKQQNKNFWFIKEFNFTIDSLPAIIRIDVGPLLNIRHFSLEIDRLKIYAEE